MAITVEGNAGMPRLTAIQIEDGARFRIGDLVEISSNSQWAGDWHHVVGEVIGIVWDRQARDFSIWLRHDGDQITDGFRVDDLTLSIKAES